MEGDVGRCCLGQLIWCESSGTSARWTNEPHKKLDCSHSESIVQLRVSSFPLHLDRPRRAACRLQLVMRLAVVLAAVDHRLVGAQVEVGFPWVVAIRFRWT